MAPPFLAKDFSLFFLHRDLSDVDRDGRINKEEFFIALHLTRFCSNSEYFACKLVLPKTSIFSSYRTSWLSYSSLPDSEKGLKDVSAFILY